jgi:hypothetical protein
MAKATRAVCPHCGTTLKSSRGVSVGKTVKCPQCAAPFTVRAEDVRPAAEAGGVDGERLAWVVCGAVIYLLGGAALAGYCFWLNARRPEPGPAAPPTQVAAGDDGGAEPPPPPPPLPPHADPAEQRKIDDAIVKGVWYLKDHTLPPGTWGDAFLDRVDLSVGFASLPGLTLLECGVPADDPVVQKAADLVRKQVGQFGSGNDGYGGSTTYQRALAILFLDRLGEVREEGLLQSGAVGRVGGGAGPRDKGPDDDLIQYLALCLMAGQHPTGGGWNYSSPALDRKLVPQLLALLHDDRQSLDDWRKAALKGGTFEVPRWDNSNTQFAILGLWAAQRHGVPIGRSIDLVEKHFRPTQQPNGSWPYATNEEGGCPWPSMTCSGLLGLAVAHAVTTDAAEKKQKPLDDDAIKRALAVLAGEIDKPGETRAPDHYFLWSLERVGVLYDLPKIDGKDWYAWGCKALLPRQRADGSWPDGAWYGNNPVLNTCFALLFLERANLAKDLTTKLQLLAEPSP